MSQPHVYTKTLAAADDDCICLSQAGTGGAFTLNGVAATGSPAVAVLDTQRRVLITCAGNDLAKTFSVYGTVEGNSAIIEQLAGGSGSTVATAHDFLTVAKVTCSATPAGNVKVGTNGVGSTPWYNFNTNITPDNTSINVQVTGTVNYTVQYTFDDPNKFTQSSIGLNLAVIPTTLDDAVLAGQTATNQSYAAYPYWGARCVINSGTGTIKMTIIQAGVAGP